MDLTYEHAQQLKLVGKMVRFCNANGEWVVGKVTKIQQDGLEIEEFGNRSSSEGYGFGFFGPARFFGCPCFVPFVNVSLFSFFLF